MMEKSDLIRCLISTVQFFKISIIWSVTKKLLFSMDLFIRRLLAISFGIPMEIMFFEVESFLLPPPTMFLRDFGIMEESLFDISGSTSFKLGTKFSYFEGVFKLPKLCKEGIIFEV